MAVAQGKMSMCQLQQFIDPGDVPFSVTCHHCAPADGLTMWKVHYAEENAPEILGY